MKIKINGVELESSISEAAKIIEELSSKKSSSVNVEVKTRKPYTRRHIVKTMVPWTKSEIGFLHDNRLTKLKYLVRHSELSKHTQYAIIAMRAALKSPTHAGLSKSAAKLLTEYVNEQF